MNDLKSSKNSKTMAILSFVFGVMAIVISWVPFERFIVIALGIAAIVLGAIELDRVSKSLSDNSSKNMAIAGIVLGGVAIVFHIIITIAWGFAATYLFKGVHMGQWKLHELGRFRHLR